VILTIIKIMLIEGRMALIEHFMVMDDVIVLSGGVYGAKGERKIDCEDIHAFFQ
jgi:hypothetical protein